MRTTVYIGLGSNLGDGRKNLHDAWQTIGEIEHISNIVLSHPYLSAPVGMDSSHWFTNGVGKLETTLEPLDLLAHLMEVEKSFGRRRDESVQGYQDRSLDLDIIYFGEQVIKSKRLELPHPCLADRLFVLEPLAEIAPEFSDPLDGTTVLDKKRRLHQRIDRGEVALQEINKSAWQKT